MGLLKKLNDFCMTIEGDDAVVRVEWSKGYAYTKYGSWTNPDIVGGVVQSKYAVEDWNSAISIFDKYDPHRIFSNDF